MKIIFLDIDGVLNCKTSRSRCGKYVGIDKDKLLRLKKIVDSTSAVIILISSWKRNWQERTQDKCKQDELANYLDAKFKDVGLVICDKTLDSLAGFYFSRGEGILEYMICKDVESYVILDDIQFDYDGCGLTDCYVKTNSEIGLTDDEVQKAIEILNGN